MRNGVSTITSELEDVLALDGAEFLGRAYIEILGRPIDPDGFRHYEAKLRSGANKRAILTELADSAEGRAYKASEPRDISTRADSDWVRSLRERLCQTGSDPNLIATDIEGLLALDDLEFVICSYWTLLGREPDSPGLEHYLRRLRAGAAKLRLVFELVASPEGRQAGTTLPGLRAAVRSHRLATIPVIGWCYRRFRQMEGDSPIERRLRTIETAISRLVREQQRETQELDAAAERVARALRERR